MFVLKNPFALRYGKIITIEDLTEYDRGLGCDCICPACKAPFEARLGKKRVHHFAHSGSGCSEELAYITGLYMFLKEYVETGNDICLPEVNIYFKASKTLTFTEDNFLEHIGFEFLEKYDTILTLPGSSAQYSHAEIAYFGDKPAALILSNEKTTLAVVVKPPVTVCKDVVPKKYKNLPTLMLDLYNYGYEISRSKTKEIFEYFKTEKFYSWIYCPDVMNLIPEANRKNDEYKAFCKKREEEKKELETKKPVLTNPPASWWFPVENKEPETKIKGVEIIKIRSMDFDRKDLIVDSAGLRWFKCKKCNGIIREDKAAEIEPDANYGLCIRCYTEEQSGQ